jgi:nucleoside 2-deoxyribosyltransferase
MKSVYLAGPDVFAPDPRTLGARLCADLAAVGLRGLFPLDNEIAPCDEPRVLARRIFEANVAMLRSCDLVLANIQPFRGPSADVGTCWEIGFAHALGKPVICYGAVGTYRERCRDAGWEAAGGESGSALPTDRDGWAIEDFGLAENLMITECAAAIVSTWEDAVRVATEWASR